MTDDPRPRNERRPVIVGGVAVAGLVAAGCALVMVTSDGSTKTPDTTEHTNEDATHARGADRQAENRSLTPMGGPSPASDGSFTTASKSNGFADFIVKFDEDPKVDAIIRQFRKDEASAKQAFENWASTKPGLSGFELTGATYSGEALLRYRFNDGTAPSRAAVDEVLKQLRNAPNVAYCDPDFTAQPGSGRD